MTRSRWINAGWLIALTVVAGSLAPLRADIYRLTASGNTIAPLHAGDIAMDAETVTIEPESDFGGFKVTAVFTMRNTTDAPASYLVAFPFETVGQATGVRSNFKVQVSAFSGPPLDDVPVELKVRD